MVLSTRVYGKLGRSCRFQAGLPSWHAEAQRRSAVAFRANGPACGLLDTSGHENLLLLTLRAYDPRNEFFSSCFPTASKVVLRHQRSMRKRVLMQTLHPGFKSTHTGESGSVALWRYGWSHPYVSSEPYGDTGQACGSRRCSCNLSRSEKLQNVSKKKKSDTASSALCSCFNVTEVPSQTASDATSVPDVSSGTSSCTAALHPERSTDDVGDDILSTEELLRVLRGLRNNSPSRTAALSGGGFQQKLSCVSVVQQLPSGSTTATCLRESRSFSTDEEHCWPHLTSSPPQPVPVLQNVSRSHDAAYHLSPPLSCDSTPSANSDTGNHRSTADFTEEVSAVSPQKNPSSSRTVAAPCSHPLRHFCLYKSLLYHLRQQSPGCYSSLHQYTISGLPLEPLMPDLPHLVLKLLKANALSTTKELVLCAHACTTLLRNSSVRGVQSMAATRSTNYSSGHGSLTYQAEPSNTSNDAWTSLCFAFETAFCQRLQQQFEHTYDHLRRLDTSENLQSSGDRLTENIWRTQTSENYEIMLASASDPKNAPPAECLTTPACRGVSLRRGDTSSTCHSSPCTSLHYTMKARTEISPVHRSATSISEPRCLRVSPCLCRSNSVDAVSSQSCTLRASCAVNELDTAAPAKPSGYTGPEARRTFGRPFRILVTENVGAGVGNLKEKSSLLFHKAKGRRSQGHIPFPHVVVPQDLSMFISSYVALAKQSNCPVSKSLIAAAACYLFLYSSHSSPQAFTLATFTVAKVATEVLANNAPSRVLSSSSAAGWARKIPNQDEACVLLSTYLGPFTSNVTLPRSSAAPRAEDLKAISEPRCTPTHSRYASSSSGSSHGYCYPVEEKVEVCRRHDAWPPQIPAQMYFSPLQLLAAGLHHWVVESASALRPHDWACILQALRDILRLRPISSSFTVAGPSSALLAGAQTNEGVGSPGTRHLEALSRRESSLAFDHRSTRNSSSEKNCFSVFSTRDRFPLAPAEHCSASSALKARAQQSGARLEADSVDLGLIENTIQLPFPNRGENCYVRHCSKTSSAGVVRAAQRTIAAAASAPFGAPSLKWPFSAVAAAIPSCFPSLQSATHQTLDPPQTWNGGSGLPRHGHGSNTQVGSRTSANSLPTVFPASTFSHATPCQGGGAADTANYCSHVRDGEFEVATTKDAPYDNIRIDAPAPPTPTPPSAAELLHAVRLILLPLQHRFNVALTLTSLPILALAAVQLHGALLDKVHTLQAHVVSRQREHVIFSRAHPMYCRNTQEGQLIQDVSVTDVDTSVRTHPTKSATPEASSENSSSSSRLSAVKSVSAMLAPVYELLCRTYEAGFESVTLTAKGGSRASGCIIFLSALVDALHLVAVECPCQKKSAGVAPTVGEFVPSNDLTDGGRRSNVVSLIGSPHISNVVYEEVECPTQRLQSTVLRLFQLTAKNVFLRKSLHSGFPMPTRVSEAALIPFDDTHITLERGDLATRDLPNVERIATARQALDVSTSFPSHPRLAWCPTPQDLVDLVKAASSLLSPFVSLDSRYKRIKVPMQFPGITAAGPMIDAPPDKCALLYNDVFNVTPTENNCVSPLHQNLSSTPSTIGNDKRHYLVLLLRACCAYVVSVLEHQVSQPRKSGIKQDVRPEKSTHPQEKPKTNLLPRDVSCLALHFYRCNLLSSVEFDAFGRYIIARGREDDPDPLSYSTALSGHDFVHLLQIFVRPEISEAHRSTITNGEQQMPAQLRARRGAWQSPFAVRVAVSMLDGMLPLRIRTFDELALAKLTFWLGSQFQKLQVYDRCNRSTALGKDRDPDGLTADFSRNSGSCSVRTPVSMRLPNASVTVRAPCRLQLPAMRGMLERATRLVVQELLRRFCEVHLDSLSSLRGGHAHMSKQSSVGGMSATPAIERLFTWVPKTTSSASSRSHLIVSERPTSHLLRLWNSTDSRRVCEDAEAYVILLLGLSKLPRALLLLPDSQIVFKVETNLGDERKKCSVTLGQPGPRSAENCGVAERSLEAPVPPGMLLLCSLLSKHQLQHFFAPRVALTDWQLKQFFSALQHLPLASRNYVLSKAATAAADKCSSGLVQGKYGLTAADSFNLRLSDFPVNSLSLKEHVLQTVFQTSAHSRGFLAASALRSQPAFLGYTQS